MSKTYSSKSCFLLLLATVVGVPAVFAAAPTEDDVRQRLTDFGLRVERQIEVARHNVERGTVDQERLDRQAEGATAALDALERLIEALPEDGRNRLAPKFQSIEGQVYNLNRAAELGSAPPRSVSSDERIRFLQSRTAGRTPPENDNCEDAFEVSLGSFAGDTSEATNDGQAICGASLNSPDVWYRFVPTESTTIIADTFGSSFDTVLSVHSECPGTMDNQMTCDDDTAGMQSAVSFDAYPGHEYVIRVSGVAGAAGFYILNVSEGGTITGSVARLDNGEPIICGVRAYDASGYQRGYDYTDPATGVYEIAHLLPLELTVGISSASGYIEELFDDIPCPSGVPYGCDVTDGDPVPVVMGQSTEGISFKLDAAGKIEGTVLETASGQPLVSALVYLFDTSGDYLGFDYTNSEGMYEFSNLAAGSYLLLATSALHVEELYDDVPCPGGLGEGCQVADGTPVPVVLNATTSGIDFSLESSPGISGTVEAQTTGLPIHSVDVRLYDAQGNQLAYRSTNSDGFYEIGIMDPGVYYVTAADQSYSSYAIQIFDGINCQTDDCDPLSGTPIEFSGDGVVTGIDFGLLELGSVTGQVVDADSSLPVSGMGVQIYDSEGIYFGGDSTDSSGMYEIDNLYSDSYFLVASDSEYYNVLFDGLPCPDGCDPTSGTPVPVSISEAVGGIDFLVSSKGSIHGTVTAEDGSGPVTKRVRLYSESGASLSYFNSFGGVYHFRGLDEGQYFLVADEYSSGSGFLEELYDDILCPGGAPDGCTVTDGTPVSVVAGQSTTDIDFVLPRAGVISGSVVDAFDGSPLSGFVYAIDVANGETRADSLYDGAFEMIGLGPGEYIVVADTSSHVDEAWEGILCTGEFPDDCDLTGATPVTIGVGSQVQMDFELQRLGRISGAVTHSEDGTPLESIVVAAYDADGDRIQQDNSESDGSFHFAGLRPGPYFVVAFSDQEYGDELFQDIACPTSSINDPGCDPTTGTQVTTDINVDTQIDIQLDRAGSLSGTIRDQRTGEPIYGVRVELYLPNGEMIFGTNSNPVGYFEFVGLNPGTYFLATDEYSTSGPYLDLLYSGIPCPTGPPGGCDPTKGDPVTVTAGEETRFVDFELPVWDTGFSGSVVDAGTGEPIAGVYVDVWDVADGDHQATLITSAAGTFFADLGPGTFVAGTDNRGDWINQIYDGIPCPEGSPYDGDCDPMTGTVITVEDDRMTTGVDFALTSTHSIFSDGFESGDFDAWDAP